MKNGPRVWYAATFNAASEYSDAIESAVGAMDSLGSEIGLSREKNGGPKEITIYFNDPPDEELLRGQLRDSARTLGLDPAGIGRVSIRTIEDQDWLAEWKRHWTPVTIGRLVIAAPWHVIEEGSGLVVRIEPNMAFGTGTHATTRACLEALNTAFESGRSLLDVGTGTGILAIAAAVLAPEAGRIAACDNDPEAVRIAAENAIANGVDGRIEFIAGTIDDIDGEFDVVVANLTADAIEPILEKLIKKTKSELILAGILAEQECAVVDRIPSGLACTVKRDGEWTSIRVSI